MNFKLLNHVTDAMLFAQGFRLVHGEDFYAIKKVKSVEDRSVFITHDREVLTWRKEDVISLIELGYVKDKTGLE